MDEIRIKKGDLFTYRSKYGGVTRGVIESLTFRYVVQEDGSVVKDFGVKSTNGIPYSLREIELVHEYLSPSQLSQIRFSLDHIQKRNREIKKGIQQQYRDNLDQFTKNVN